MGDIAETVELVVSELVTNGVQASRELAQAPSVELRLLGDNAEIVVEVRDDSPLPPAPAPPSPDSEGGRGLLLVDFLCREWSWYPCHQHNRKVVWAVIDRKTP